MEIQQNLAKRGNRLLAYFIDIIPIVLLVFGISYLFFGFDETWHSYLNRGNDIEPRVKFLKARNWIRDFSLVTWIVYSIIMEASAAQGTLGKSIMGIKVVNEYGDRMTLNQSIGRNAGKTLSFLVFGLGFVWILFDKKKQSWHDKLNKTYVVNKHFLS